MSNQNQSVTWRTVVETVAISAAIYLLIGAPGIPTSWKTGSKPLIKTEKPVARAQTETLVYPDRNLQCPEHKYGIHVFSSSPLVVYINGFLGDSEAEHLVEISNEKWQVSTVFNEGVETTDDLVRKSEKALIERDTVVQCIEQRALSIQGWPAETFIERLWTQRYNVSGHYAHHYDWATESKQSRRVSTFMVYLQAPTSGGGTNFPQLQPPKEARWCEFVECSVEDGIEGVTFKPKKGTAVYWENFDPSGRGYKETIHAGLPVTGGVKIGLNIWSWYQAGHATG